MKDGKLAVVVGLIAVGGMAAGVTCLGSESVSAQVSARPTYTRCFFGRQESVDVDNSGTVATPDASHLINVPAGWTVVGAGSNGGSSTILLCQ